MESSDTTRAEGYGLGSTIFSFLRNRTMRDRRGTRGYVARAFRAGLG